MKLTPSGFAKIIGVSTRRVNAAIHAGLIYHSVEMQPYGLKTRYFIDKEKGIAEWVNNIDPSKQRDISKAAETRKLIKDKNSAYFRAKTKLEFFKAKSMELEYLEKAGNLLPAEHVKMHSFKIGRRIRDSLFSMPDRIAAELASMKNQDEISRFLEKNLLSALQELENLGKFR